MKKVILLLILFASTLPSDALVKIESSLNKGQKIGKFGDIKKAPKEIYISQFCVWYRTWRQSDGKDNTSIVMRRELGLSEQTALEITNAGLAYLQAQLEAKGYAISVFDSTAVTEAKTYKKYYEKKDNDAGINMGNVAYYHQPEDNPNDHRIGTWAEGVVSAYLGHKAQGGHYGALSHELGGKEGKISLSFTVNIDFLRWEVSHTSNYVHQNAVPELRLMDDILLGQTLFGYHTNKKGGGKIYGGHNYINDDGSWLVDQVSQDEGNTVANWVIDDEAFKAAAVELLKTYIDELVPKIDESKMKGK